MTIKLKTPDLQQFAEDLERFRREMLPDEPNINGGFYMIQPNELYADEEIDNEIIGQLDKLVCRYEGHHKLLEKWQLAKGVRLAWGIRLEDSLT